MKSNKKPRPWLPSVNTGHVYHVTHRSNLLSIAKHGLIPRVPKDMSDTKAVYVFPNKEDMQTALGSWLGERIEDIIEEEGCTDDWVSLAILNKGINWDDCISDVAFEIGVLHIIKPEYILVLDAEI